MDRASIMDQHIWLTEGVRGSRDTRTVRFCSVMARTRDSNSCNSNTNNTEKEIDESLSSYTDDD